MFSLLNPSACVLESSIMREKEHRHSKLIPGRNMQPLMTKMVCDVNCPLDLEWSFFLNKQYQYILKTSEQIALGVSVQCATLRDYLKIHPVIYLGTWVVWATNFVEPWQTPMAGSFLGKCNSCWISELRFSAILYMNIYIYVYIHIAH